MLPRVKSVSYLDGYRLKLRFTNKTEGIIDFRQKIVGRGGVFKPLEDIVVFRLQLFAFGFLTSGLL